MKRYLLVIFTVFCLGQHIVHGAIKILSLRGHEITPYVNDIIQLCDKIYSGYPYYYNGDNEGYEAYLKSYAQSKDSIICLVLDEKLAVGIAAGIPMMQTREIYQQPLLAKGYSLSTLFYLGEFGLKPEYQGRGIEEILYQHIEKYAHSSGKYHTLCFWELEHPLNLKDQKPSYIPKDNFWIRLGFVRRPELNFLIYWTNIGALQESAHTAVYWLKSLQ